MEQILQTRRLSVLHVNTSSQWRGGERQTMLLAERLPQYNVTSCIAAPPDSALFIRARDAGIAVVPFAPHGELDLFAVYHLRRVIRRHRVEIVHAHTAHAHGCAALACLGLRDVALIVTRRFDKPVTDNVLSRLKYLHCDRMIAISEKIRRNCIDGGMAAGKVVCIHSGIDLSVHRRTMEKPDVRALPGSPSGSIIAGTVAALTPEKDIATLLEAVALVTRRRADIFFFIVGDCPEREALSRQADILGVGNNVVFTGRRNDADQLIAGFDIFILPSRSEGLGSSILDAMAARSTVVAARTGGIPEIIEDGVNGLLFDPGDSVTLAEKILTLAENRKLRRTLSDAGAKRVEMFDIQRTVNATAQVYRAVRLKKAGLQVQHAVSFY